MSEPYTIASREDLYNITRHDLIQEYKEAVASYAKAKARVNGIRIAIRGLSILLDLPIPEEGKAGPILPEEKWMLDHAPRQGQPEVGHMRRHALSQLKNEGQGNNTPKL